MKRIRVVHIIHSMEVGGAQRQLLNLFHAIDPARFDLRLICLVRKGAFGEQLEREGFPVVELGKSRPVALGMLHRLTGILREWRPDIVHCSIFTANFWGRIAALMARVPVIYAQEQSTVSLDKWYRRVIDRLLATRSRAILAVSSDLRDQIIARERIAPERIRVLYNAIDCRAISKAAPRQPVPDLPGRTGLRIGAVGRLDYRKDHLTMIRAAARVIAAIPEATFFIAGEGPERRRLEQEIARLDLRNHFLLLGERNDIPALLHAFDLYALTSTTEGLSLSIIEAMAAGCPVVATRVGGNAELLDSGRAGRLVDPQDPDKFAEAILDLIRDPDGARALAEKGRKRALEKFDIHPVARELEALYAEAFR